MNIYRNHTNTSLLVAYLCMCVCVRVGARLSEKRINNGRPHAQYWMAARESLKAMPAYMMCTLYIYPDEILKMNDTPPSIHNFRFICCGCTFVFGALRFWDGQMCISNTGADFGFVGAVAFSQPQCQKKKVNLLPCHLWLAANCATGSRQSCLPNMSEN